MGNQQIKPLSKRKNYSFDAGDFNNFNIDKIFPTNHISSSMDIKNTSSINKNSSSMIQMPSLSKQVSHIITRQKLSTKQQNARLQKLAKTNDQLRKQLIQINKKLSQQLHKKKMPTLMASHQQKIIDNSRSLDNRVKSSGQIQKDKYKIIALKKQLQNAYSQVQMYKRQIEALRKNDSFQGDMKLQTVEDKITAIDGDISTLQKSLQSMKIVVGKQNVDISRYEEELVGEDVQQCRREITMIKDRLKKIKEIARKKEKDEKMRHQLLIQMERKLREINSQYVPQRRNWAAQEPTSKSRIANIKQKKTTQHTSISKQKEQKQKQFRYLPSKLQLQQVQTQLKHQKQSHEQYHKKIDQQLKRRNDYKQQRKKIQQQLQSIYKTLQTMQYKKDRYMQLIMGNVTMGEVDEMLSIGDEVVRDGEVIVVGESLQRQEMFSDVRNIANCDKVVDRLRIVMLHVWTSDKGYIMALQFYYTNGEAFFVGKKSHEFNIVTQKHTLQLPEGDFVRNVMGTFSIKNKFLEFIVFESVKGKVLKVGKQSFKNNNFNLRIGKGQRPAMISGACVNDGSCWRINRLQFFIKSL